MGGSYPPILTRYSQRVLGARFRLHRPCHVKVYVLRHSARGAAGDILEHVRQGRWSFLFDTERRFIEPRSSRQREGRRPIGMITPDKRRWILGRNAGESYGSPARSALEEWRVFLPKFSTSIRLAPQADEVHSPAIPAFASVNARRGPEAGCGRQPQSYNTDSGNGCRGRSES